MTRSWDCAHHGMTGAQPASLRTGSPNDRRSSMLSSRAQDDTSGAPVFTGFRLASCCTGRWGLPLRRALAAVPEGPSVLSA